MTSLSPTILQKEHDIHSMTSSGIDFPVGYTRSEALSGPVVSQSTGVTVWRTEDGLCIETSSGMSGLYVPGDTKALSDIQTVGASGEYFDDLSPERLFNDLGLVYGETLGDEMLQTKLGDLISLLRMAPSLLSFLIKVKEDYHSKEHLPDRWTPRHTVLKRQITGVPRIKQLLEEKRLNAKRMEAIVRSMVGAGAPDFMSSSTLETILFRVLEVGK